MKTIKCVVVGDGAVGKTCMLMSYTLNKFPSDYIPTVFENYAVDIDINQQKYVLDLFDTAGQEAYDRLRPIAYPGTDVFLICFSVVNPDSYSNLEHRWVPEILHHNSNTPYLIVGTQIDLRESTEILNKLSKYGQRPISYEKGEKLAKQFKKQNAYKYVECSALTQKGLKNVFDEAIKAALIPPKKRDAQYFDISFIFFRCSF